MNSRPICFDMDGVIFNSESSHYAAFRRTFEPYGISLSVADYQKYFAGKTDEQGLADFMTGHKLELDVPTAQALKRDHYAALAESTVAAYDETITAIKELAATHPLALVTSSPLSQVTVLLKRFNIRHYFSVLVTAEDVVRGKPDPESYLLAATRLGCDPSACYAVEDAPSGIMAAKRAGMRCIALTTTHAAAELQQADRVLEHLQADAFIN